MLIYILNLWTDIDDNLYIFLIWQLNTDCHCTIQFNRRFVTNEIDWLVLNVNFSNISALSWCEQILFST